jgi:predicted PurR-regulated permease PerM
MDAESITRLIPPITRSLVGMALIGFMLMLMHLAVPVLVPILFAFFLAALAMPAFRWLQGRGVKRGPALFVLLAVLLAGGIGLILLALVAAGRLQEGLAMYGDQLAARLTGLEDALEQIGLSAAGAGDWLTSLGVSVLDSFVAALIDVAGNGLFSLAIVGFFLFESQRFMSIVRSDFIQDRPVLSRTPQVAETAVRYFGIRTRLNVITGIGVTLICLLVQVDYPFLWGVTAFFLSYIPYIGLLTAMLPPALLALAEHGWPQATIVVVGIVLINLLIENVLEPGYTGRRLQLSPTIVFLSFFFGPGCWGRSAVCSPCRSPSCCCWYSRSMRARSGWRASSGMNP